MAGIEKNRVFDKTSIEGLRDLISGLLKTAEEVTKNLKTEMDNIITAASDVPPEAKHEGMATAAQTLKGTLDAQIYEDMRTAIEEKLDDLTAEIPLYDSRSAEVLTELTTAAGSLTGMLGELKELIGQGSLTMSLEEFKSRLEEYEKKWTEGGISLDAKMQLAMTYLKGLVLFSEFSKDPVNLSTGNFYYEKEDIRVNGRLPLVFKRHYNAMDKGAGALGEGWSHSLEARVGTVKETEGNEPEKIILYMEDGRETVFARDNAEPEKKGKEETGHAVFRDIYTGSEEIEKTGEGYLYKKGRLTYAFDKDGRLVKMTDKDGNAIACSYDENGRLTKADQIPAGTEETKERPCFTFRYREDGSLKELTDHTGRRVGFFIMEGKLSEVTDPEGNTTCYRYGENGKVRAIKNPRGTMTVRNEYDEKGRIVKQRFPDKGFMCYTYDDKENRTVLTERNGSVITYVQDEKLRNVGIIYHNGSESCTYNDRNQKTSRTDRNGNTTRCSYDDKGNITGIINALGEKTSLTYNADGKLMCVKSCGKEILRNGYDKEGRLTQSSDALGRTTRTAYDERGLVTKITAPDGSSTEISYDAGGNVTAITDPYGVPTTYRYDALNRVTETTDGNGNTTRYAYDKKDRIISVTNPEGRSRKYAYNPSGKVTETEDFDGRTATVEYNDLNRPCRLTDKEGRITERHYDKMWNVSEEITPTGAVTKFAYDEDNRLSEVTLSMAQGEDPVSVIRYAYDPAGNLTETEAGGADSAISRISYAYDALNRVTGITDAAGGITAYEYDTNGKIKKVTDPAGNTETRDYNAAGELIRRTDAAGRATAYEYNALGQLSCITDHAGRKTVYTYENGGRLTKTEYPDNRSISYTYDKNGNIKTKENSDGYALTYTYDCMNRVIKVTGGDGQEKSYEYDVMGNVTTMTDANGNTTSYEYTPSGKLSAVTDALGNRTEYKYDALDNLILINRKGEDGQEERVTEYVRDPSGHVKAVKDAAGKAESYTYDALGRLTKKHDRDGNTTLFTHTPDGKTKSILYADGKRVEMEYDALRKLAVIKDWLGETKIERDSLGRTQAVTDPQGRKVSYEWGESGELKGITYPDGKTASYTYDGLLRLTEMRLPPAADETESESITYSYDADGRLSEKRFPGGLRTVWHYDGNGQLGELIHEDGEGILDKYAYEYDPMGNKTAVTEQRRGLDKESGRYEYGYDALNRLATVTKDGKALRSYTYDEFGNRNTTENHETGRKTEYAYDILDRLTERKEHAGGRTDIREYLYDNRGNLIKESENGTAIHSYAYNAMNRLGYARGMNGEEAEYIYNGLGHRTGRKTNRGREDYLLDITRPFHNMLMITDEEGSMTFYRDGNITAMTDSRETGRKEAGMSAPVTTTKEGTTQETYNITPVFHCYLHDGLGSPVRVSGYDNDTNGDYTGYLTYGYDEFGNDLYDEWEESGIPNPYSRQGEEQPFGYTGYRRDEVSGTYFAQAREYQPRNGRFTAEDVIKGNGAFPETLNRYGYCFGNPLTLVDLNGQIPLWLLYGIATHMQMEVEFLALYMKDVGSMASEDTYGRINVYIPGGGRMGGRGFADIVLYTKEEAYIYEIKPISYYNDLTKKKNGEAQLNRYIAAFNDGVHKPTVGNMEYIDSLLFNSQPFAGAPNVSIKYEMFNDSPGMIYYTIENSDVLKENEYALPVRLAEYKSRYLILEGICFNPLTLSLIYLAASSYAALYAYANCMFPILIMDEDIMKSVIIYPDGNRECMD